MKTRRLQAIFVRGAILAIIFLLCFKYTKSPPEPKPRSGCDPWELAVKNAAAVEKERLQHNEDRIAEALELSEKVYQNYVKKRRNYRAFHKEQDNAWKGGLPIWDHFLPAFTCPYSIQRVGGLGDGKWTCGFELYEKKQEQDPKQGKESKRPCVVYSFGVGGDSRFEAEVLNRTDCQVFAFDESASKDVPGVRSSRRLWYLRVVLSHEDDGKRGLSLGQIMRKNKHTFIDFLKVDIKGQSEFKVFNQIMDEFEYLPFGQMSLELHADHQGKTLSEVYKWWERLEEKGLRAFKSELNYHPVLSLKQHPWVMEYSFVNVRNSQSKFNLGDN